MDMDNEKDLAELYANMDSFDILDEDVESNVKTETENETQSGFFTTILSFGFLSVANWVTMMLYTQGLDFKVIVFLLFYVVSSRYIKQEKQLGATNKFCNIYVYLVPFILSTVISLIFVLISVIGGVHITRFNTTLLIFTFNLLSISVTVGVKLIILGIKKILPDIFIEDEEEDEFTKILKNY